MTLALCRGVIDALSSILSYQATLKLEKHVVHNKSKLQ